jgi:group I intron endonuclease
MTEDIAPKTRHAVYRIVCEASGKSYIGLTKAGVDKRFRAHKYLARRGASGALYNAIRKHGPEAFVVETVARDLTVEQAQAMEIALIAAEGTRAPGGYNLAAGGERGLLGYKLSSETRAKMSETHRKRQQDPAPRRRTSEALRGREKSPEHLAKIAEALRGNVLSETTKRKLRDANIGKKQSDETVAKRSAKLRGVTRPPETRARMAEAQKARRARERQAC